MRIRAWQILINLALVPILFYQKFMRHLHNRVCIYEPTCSHYTVEAIKKYGPITGWKYGILRVKRCNGALYKGGVDRI